jgi:hypothetical protein
VCSRLAAFVDTYGAAMIPEKVKSPETEPSAKSEVSQPQEDSDKIRGEVFKRMFPDVPPKPSE